VVLVFFVIVSRLFHSCADIFVNDLLCREKRQISVGNVGLHRSWIQLF
jgi:hypothetical protein